MINMTRKQLVYEYTETHNEHERANGVFLTYRQIPFDGTNWVNEFL